MTSKIAKKILEIEKEKLLSEKEPQDWELITALDLAIEALEERPKGEWEVIGVKNSFWHVVCPKCKCAMSTEFTSHCPNCGEPKKEINIAELNMRGDEE